MRKLESGEKVRVNTEQLLSHKLDAAGHICVVMAFETVTNERVRATSEYRYILGWRHEDNPGKEYPSCIDAYWFLEEEIVPLMEWRIAAIGMKVQSLPDV